MASQRSSRIAVAGLLALLLGSAGRFGTMAREMVNNQEQEISLRKRVQEFYSFMQAGNYSRAEEYLTEESKEGFRNQAKGPFQAFEIDSVKLDTDGQTATVVVGIHAMSPLFPAEFAFPRSTNWVVTNGTWRLKLPPRDPNANLLKAMFEPPIAKQAPPLKPPPFELKFAQEVQNIETVEPHEVKIVRFPFKNVSDHVVRLAEVKPGCECIRLKTEKMEYKPGESGVLAFELDPKHEAYAYGLNDLVMVKTDPGGGVKFLGVMTFVKPDPSLSSKPKDRREPPGSSPPGPAKPPGGA